MSQQSPIRFPGQKPPEPEQKFLCRRCFDAGLFVVDESDPPRNGGEILAKMLPCTCAAGTEVAPVFAELINPDCACGQPKLANCSRCADCEARVVAEWRRSQGRTS